MTKKKKVTKKKTVTKKATKKTGEPAASPARDEKGRVLPGQALNPTGRPKMQKCIPDILRLIGKERCKRYGKDIPKLEALLRKVYDLALKGDHKAIDFITNRTEGKVPDQLIQSEVPIDFMIDDPADEVVLEDNED